MSQTISIETLTEKATGKILQPEDPDYDQARALWNGMIDRRPAIIAQCTEVSDVVAAVKFARENDVVVSVKSGGHGVAGRAVCDGGLMIDLSEMKAVDVDPDARTARVEAGATLADLDGATQKYSLATPGGIVSETGVAGLTLGGGQGHLSRKLGLTIDNLLEAEVVLASGEVVRASQDDNPDLFWAIRGGGGNFGIVTSFTFKLHEVGPEVLVGQAFYPFDCADDVLKAYRKLMADAPDDLGCYALALNVPPAPPFPEDYHGQTCIALVACYAGDSKKGESLLAPLQELGEPIFAAISAMPYTSLQSSFDAGVPKGARYYWKANYMNELSDEAIQTFIEYANPLAGPLSIVGFEPMGGAMNRVDPDATAYPHRTANFALGIWSGWTASADDDKNVAWTRKLYEAMAPFCTGGVYLNYLDQDDQEKVASAVGSNYERLRKIKKKYDPDNFFSMNHNIPPTS